MNRRVRAINLALFTILLCSAFAFGQNSSLRILGIPQPVPPGDAERGHIQGTVILRIQFLATGQIGTVAVVKGLTPKLTELAVEAARKITFTPQQVDGKLTDVFKQLECSYIYGSWTPRRSLPVFPPPKPTRAAISTHDWKKIELDFCSFYAPSDLVRIPFQ